MIIDCRFNVVVRPPTTRNRGVGVELSFLVIFYKHWNPKDSLVVVFNRNGFKPIPIDCVYRLALAKRLFNLRINTMYMLQHPNLKMTPSFFKVYRGCC
jgi:hypothetical protein